MKASRRRTRGVPATGALLASLLIALPGSADAFELSYDAGVGIEHHDNINLSEDDPIDENVLFGELRFVAKHDSPRVEFKSRGNLRYMNYLGGSFDDEMRGELAAQIDWTILPNRLHWVFEDYMSRQAIDIFSNPTPGNQQQVNVFVTGPTLLARLGSSSRAQLDVRYTNSYAEESEQFNGDRLVARLAVIRELSPVSLLSFNLEGARAEFDDPTLSTDYTRYDTYFSYQRRLPAMTFKADLGYTRLTLTGVEGTASAPLLRSAFDWRISSRAAFTGRLDYQFADATDSLIRRSSELASETYSSVLTSTELLDLYDRVGNYNLVVSSDAYRERRIALGYRYNGDRFSFRVHPYVQRVHYQADLNPTTQNFDRSSHGSALAIDYRLRPQMALSFQATNENISFGTVDRRDRVSSVGLSLADRSARRWRWRIDLDHYRRDSTQDGRSYRDNVIGFTLTRRR